VLTDLFNSLQSIVHNFPLLLIFVLIFWLVAIVNWMSDYRLNRWGGIRPRQLLSLPGIVLSAFLHGNIVHLVFNTLPLFALAGLVMAKGLSMFIVVTSMIIILSGSLIWLFARKGIHIGASGLVMGYWGYLMTLAIAERSIVAILLALICVYYFGGMYVNLVPNKRVSWEGHVFGFVAGIATVFLSPFVH